MCVVYEETGTNYSTFSSQGNCFLDMAQSGCLNLNYDKTTSSQKKLQGAAISGMILSVNEIPDSSADSMIADISQELKNLREVAHTLQLPNADKINWTLIQSSSSDSASTQKRFNKLVQEKERKLDNASARFVDVLM